MRALIVEDDPRYGAHLERLLDRAGFVTDWEADAELALEKGYDPAYAIIFLDLMLSARNGEYERAVDGFSLLRRWRKKGVSTPVLVLTASRTDLEDTTQSYEWDADYEIKRPGEEFDALLLAWARSRSARGSSAAAAAPKMGQHGPMSVDLELREVRLDGKPIDLSQTEYNVLMSLLKSEGAWLSVDEIASGAFGPGCENPHAQVYEYIKRLRQKLGFNAIRNQRGRGYRFALADGAETGDGAANGPAGDDGR
ncbi:MAG: response regulator transcription factor [Pseudomonadota bacterium]